MPAEHKGTAKPPAMHPFVLVCSCHALRMVLACNVVCLWLFFFHERLVRMSTRHWAGCPWIHVGRRDGCHCQQL